MVIVFFVVLLFDGAILAAYYDIDKNNDPSCRNMQLVYGAQDSADYNDGLWNFCRDYYRFMYLIFFECRRS
jgi:hypothetical protein